MPKRPKKGGSNKDKRQHYAPKRGPAPKKKQKPGPIHEKPEVEGMRLNKYVAHAGICSRRQAADYVKEGLVTVNGEVETAPGYQVQEGDEIRFKGELIQPEERKVYILLNKPRDYITTVKDDRGRQTVLDIVANEVPERIFPVGRLDRDTSGLLLLTNDGDLAKKLSHPSHKVRKFYQVTLDKNVTPEHIEAIRAGLTLEDGEAPVDGVDYVIGKSKKEVGIELHIGRNRIVRRIFEQLGYEVKKLDRVYYAGLTKKDLPRGFFRHLKEQEIIMLKHFT
jgi:23S rRNA pseudouridine2605 synthase